MRVIRSFCLFFGLFLASLSAYAAPKSELWPFWQTEEGSSVQSGTIDHSPWQGLLTDYLHRDSGGLNLFDYQSASQSGRAQLDNYLVELQGLDPRAYPLDEQKAYWFNLYNALTVKLILDNYPVKSITKLGKGFFKFGPWDDPVAMVAGETLTLNDIEHRILRPIWKDPRIHFAVNCASIGCPNLQPIAFTAENTEELLNRAAEQYLAHPRGLQFDSGGRLQLSSIFDWYAEDFGENESKLLNYISTYTPKIIAEKLRNYDGKIVYEYDWMLNEFVEPSVSK